MPGVPTEWLDVTSSNNSSFLTSNYDFRSLVFPSDLGQSHLSHYMMININVSEKLLNVGEFGSMSLGQRYSTSTNDISKVERLRQSDGFLERGITGNARGIFGARSTKRIAQSIALYMPTPLIFNTNNVYEEISLTALGGRLGVALAAQTSGFRNMFQSMQNGVSAGARAIDAIGEVVGSTGVSNIAALTGNPINPAVEILFTSVALRQFAFELIMIPRNEGESKTIKNIVKTLRFHAAPELNPTTASFTFINPADFDITFFSKGKENKELIRINTCVMDRIEVDYTPISGNFSAFENDHPVAVRLSMGLREVEPIHKKRILQGF